MSESAKCSALRKEIDDSHPPSSEPRGKYNKSLLFVPRHNRQSKSWNAAA